MNFHFLPLVGEGFFFSSTIVITKTPLDNERFFVGRLRLKPAEPSLDKSAILRYNTMNCLFASFE